MATIGKTERKGFTNLVGQIIPLLFLSFYA